VFRSYSECCIDDVTASHATRNDMIVKFGHACFTTKETQIKAISKADETYTKQVLYVVPQSEVPTGFKEAVLAIGKPVYLMA
jgi:diphthamide biosynthesis enzyme Dph1/Dph2-like protein